MSYDSVIRCTCPQLFTAIYLMAKVYCGLHTRIKKKQIKWKGSLSSHSYSNLTFYFLDAPSLSCYAGRQLTCSRQQQSHTCSRTPIAGGYPDYHLFCGFCLVVDSGEMRLIHPFQPDGFSLVTTTNHSSTGWIIKFGISDCLTLFFAQGFVCSLVWTHI